MVLKIKNFQKASDVFTKNDFIMAMALAEANAKNAWEEEFVENVKEKFEDYGIEMFFSDKQKEILDRIAYGTGI